MAGVKGRRVGHPHDPETCCTCLELPHLAGYRLPAWVIAEMIGLRVGAIAKHLRDHPELAARIPTAVLDDIRRADSAERHTRSSRPRQETAA